MNQTYIIAQEIDSKAEFTKGFFLQDFFFVFGYMAITLVLKSAVHTKLQVFYLIFSLLMALFLTMKSKYNKKRRNYESVIIMLRKKQLTYKPIIKGSEKYEERKKAED